MQNEKTDAEEAVERYGASLFRMCFSMLGNYADSEDAVSEVFLRYLEKAPTFHSEEHRKAWLFKVASNVCKDMRRKRRYTLDLDAVASCAVSEEENNILEAIFRLPPKYKTILYLYYMEGYRTAELANMLKISEVAVRKRLEYARKKLKLEYEVE